VSTVDVERLLLHTEHVGRDTGVVALETRQERHNDESGGRVT